ncbi:uncharacterized protein PAC_03372 [Phialocephala subalpina]|uniref:Zn(2)-C6 fungal-type domain-containing protein n=1 Tax=Phialocephala subalpina TaxID=576137 RepID=A0A1L7WL84_9HELO|nr:uncharacterized protein PAC_03372 [Phialocephala subalpina]
MHHRFWSHMETPYSYLHEPYNNINVRVPEQGPKAHYQHRGNWEDGHDEMATLPTSTGDTVFQRLHEWDDDCGIIRLQNHNFCSDDRWKRDGVSPEWESLPPELQSTMESFQMPISTNPGTEKGHLFLHSVLGTEGSRDVTEEIEFTNLFQRNTARFGQSPQNLCLLGESALSTPFNSEFNSMLLEHSINNKQDNVLFQPPYCQDQFPSFLITSNHGQSLPSSWNLSMDCGSQPDAFNDSFTVLPAQTHEPIRIPQDRIILRMDSKASRASLNECLPISSAYTYPEDTSMTLVPPSLPPDALQDSTSHGPGSLHHHQATGEIMCEKENITGLKPKDAAVEEVLPEEATNWQHVSSSELKPHQVIKDVRQKRKHGGRHGRLTPESAKNAREMRLLRACLPCVIMKRRCSPGDICKRCSTLSTPSLGKKICTRAHLEDFSDLLFPVPFVSYLRSKSVNQLSSELSLGFVGVDFEVALTCGSEYPPLNLAVSEFALKSDQAARVATCPPPIAVSGAYTDLLERCRNHIKLVVKQERTLQRPILKHGHKISRLTLKAIARHYGSVPSSSTTSTLEKAMMLHAIYKFMATTLTITESSKRQLGDSLRKPARIEYDSSIASRLLNRQIKSAMHALRERLMREVLEELEGDLKTKSKAVWTPCFCVALILCMCVEEAQIAMDAFAMHTRVLGAVQDAPASETTIESCLKLDDLLFNHLLELFHGVYKTHQTSKPHRSCRVYNPIRDGPEIDIKEGLDQKSADLVSEFRGIIADHKDEIVERAATPSFTDGHDSLARHLAFRDGNSARLVSSFLKSFYSF